MASTKTKTSVKPKAKKAAPTRKSATKAVKSKPKAKALIVDHRKKLLLVACLALVVLVTYFSLSIFRSVSAETSVVSWTGNDPVFSVDVDQSKPAAAPCNTEQVFLGNDVDAATVCVVKRDTWRYGKYSYNACTWRGCSIETGYAIGYGTDTKMYRMREMPEFLAPYLVPGTDTMVVRDLNGQYYTLGIIKDFQLQFKPVTAADGSTEYAYNGTPYFKFSKPNGERVPVQAVGASMNGNWLVAEAPDIGLFRINLVSFETKRFSTTVYDYWKGSNPTLEFAVSNDGNTVAAMGFNAGFITYTVNSTCGDTLTDTMTKATPIASACQQKDMTSYMTNNVTGYQFGLYPSFDENAGILNMQAYYKLDSSDGTKWVTLTYPTTPDTGDGNCLMSDGIGTTADETCCVTNRSYPYMIRQMLGKQAEKLKVSCASGGTTDGATQDAWKEWQDSCLSLDTQLQASCKGITLEEFLQMYKGGAVKEAAQSK